MLITIRKLFFFILITLAAFLISLLPVHFYLSIKELSLDDLNNSSIYFYGSLILGSFTLFLFSKKPDNINYSEWSMLLHRMILDHYNLSKSLFRIEIYVYKRIIKTLNEKFVIISGLARAGTTAFTNTLYESGNFHSLSYDNMPFLLAVNLWRVFYRPQKNKLRERPHGDNLKFGYKTIEALEEYFFKTMLNDAYIKEKSLTKHEIHENVYKSYIQYQNLIRRQSSTTYLSKNNNFVLRYESLRQLNSKFFLIMMFRSPADHAYSLLNQHKRFSKLHREDSFTLEYMNWLGHHEFGLNHKTMQFTNHARRKFVDPEEINYWLQTWIDYYSYILTLPKDNHLILVDYKDLCENPKILIMSIGREIKINLSSDDRKPYKKNVLHNLEINTELLQTAQSIHEQLEKKKINIYYR